MKRQKRKTTTKRKEAGPSSGQPAAATAPRKKLRSRRDLLQNAGYGVLGLGVFGAGGWYLASSVHASILERDFSRLGNGIPTVVQIHDPQCPQCRDLQREVCKALSELDDAEIQYLVADIRQPEGRAFAAENRVGHVTVLLFDGKGTRRGVMVGQNSSDVLLSEFRNLIRRSASG
ncbi:hypothetical protein [Pelagibius sp.]|uniref:hypothetical protein n=1 Tax=Pelagibius sp. TaxID=1931238 RepID=UPI00263559AA|nr:hypothetical protein [Pelagibius sp.]